MIRHMACLIIAIGLLMDGANLYWDFRSIKHLVPSRIVLLPVFPCGKIQEVVNAHMLPGGLLVTGTRAS